MMSMTSYGSDRTAVGKEVEVEEGEEEDAVGRELSREREASRKEMVEAFKGGRGERSVTLSREEGDEERRGRAAWSRATRKGPLCSEYFVVILLLRLIRLPKPLPSVVIPVEPRIPSEQLAQELDAVLAPLGRRDRELDFFWSSSASARENQEVCDGEGFEFDGTEREGIDGQRLGLRGAEERE
jgi:hypothetical protein